MPKRTLDVAVSATLLLVALPLLLAVAVAVKLDSRGPVFFRCPRVGFRGREFRMLKFRKMRDGASGPALTVSEDDRLTRVGRFLLRSKLDELPQLWNVLRGEMSLVGPRPEHPSFVELRADDYREILEVVPGITGLTQLAFVREAAILDQEDRVGDYVARLLPQKAALDRLYAGRRTLLFDLRILGWTAVALFTGREIAVHRGTGEPGLRRRAAVVAPVATDIGSLEVEA